MKECEVKDPYTPLIEESYWSKNNTLWMGICSSPPNYLVEKYVKHI
jgi:hypothetical protein